ncbi:MAG: hypothetical protein WAV13_12195 [Thermodesulfovibrionales bacterium]
MNPIKKRILNVFIVSITVGLLSSAAVLHSAQPDDRNSQNVVVRIDAKQTLGPVPYAFRTGVFLNSLPTGYPQEKFFKDMTPGMMEFSIDYYPELLNSTSYDDFFSKLPDSNLTKWVKQGAGAGADIYLRLMPVPKWLWKTANGGRKAPKDYDAWAKYVQGIVDFYNNKLHINAKYIVWDEPDGFWEGSTEEFFQLYKYSVIGLKKANKSALVGGPATSNFTQKINKAGKTPLILDLLKYSQNTNVNGSKLPVDILVWHTFDAAPVRDGQYRQEINRAKKWLKEHGYEGAELNMGSWTALEPYKSSVPNARDTEFLSSYVISSVLAIAESGFERHAFFNLFEDWRDKKKPEFGDELGIMTRNFVIKPAYNAFQMLNMVKGKGLKVSVDDPLLATYASADSDEVFIILSNFVPTREMSVASAKTEFRTLGYTPQDLKAFGLNKESIKEFSSTGKIETSKLPPDLRQVAERNASVMKAAGRRLKNPLDVEINIEHLPFTGKVKVEQYLIDSRHSNSYAHRDRITAEIKAGRQDALKAAEEYLRGSLSAQDFERLVAMRKKLSKAEILKRLSPEQRKQALKAFEKGEEVLHQRIEKINQSSAVKLQKVEDTLMEVSGSFKKKVTLEPYGAALIVLRK